MESDRAVIRLDDHEYRNVQDIRNFFAILDILTRYEQQRVILDQIYKIREIFGDFLEEFYKYVTADKA